MAKEPSTKNETSKLNQAGQPVKPSIFAFPHSGDITHSKKKKIILLVLAAVALLLIAGLLYVQLTNSGKQNDNTVNEGEASGIVIPEEEIVEEGGAESEDEADRASYEELKKSVASYSGAAGREEFDLYSLATINGAALQDDSAKDYANYIIQNYADFVGGPGARQYEGFQLISQGEFEQGLSLIIDQ